MKKRTALFFFRLLVTLFLFTFLMGAPLYGADFSGEIVEVDGEATLFFKSSAQTIPVVIGQNVSPGDRIETGADSEVEILFADGNVMLIDEETKITIKKLALNEDKSKESIFDMAIGQTKNRVSKLLHKKSRFEIHTKSAVAGVTGTPDWVVSVDKKGKTDVDLLGKRGEKGQVFVRGKGKWKKLVLLTPGMRTTALRGKAPEKPFPIAPKRVLVLQKQLVIKTPEAKREEKRKEFRQQTHQEPKEVEKKEEQGQREDEEQSLVEEETRKKKKRNKRSRLEIMTEHISRAVSVTHKTEETETQEEDDSPIARGDGSLPGVEQTPTGTTANVRIKINVQ